MHKKINIRDYNTDKSSSYFKNYDNFFSPFRENNIKLLELGIDKGGSLLLWHDYFKNGVIVGLDIKPVPIENTTERIRIYSGLQEDTSLLDKIRKKEAPDGFDIIIDDCSHNGELTRISFWHLFDNHLKPGGIYIIEDWGTGYWKSYPDGRYYKLKSKTLLQPLLNSVLTYLGKFDRKFLPIQLIYKFIKIIQIKWLVPKFHSHNFGMVGFIKELVDECGMGDITHPINGIPPYRRSKFDKLQISHGQVFILKAKSLAEEHIKLHSGCFRTSNSFHFFL